ncbi:putative DNA binding domain-containing protein [bacterium]|nr:putative DNA binding domain-containing protein [bacterium]
MKKNDIARKLYLGENQTIEFKTFCRAKSVGPVVCSFLNSNGGYLICGVDDKGQLIGLANTETILHKIEKNLFENISPKALISVEKHDLNEKTVIVIEVPAGKDIPYAYNNNIYIRETNQTLKADVETIRDMVMRRQIEPERWERRFSIADLDIDLSEEEIKLAVKDAIKVGKITFRDSNNLIKVLEDFSSIKYGEVTNAGDVLFGINTALRYPQVRIRAAAFPTDKADDTFRDIKSFEGPLVSVLHKLENFIVQNTPTIARFDSNSMKRSNEPLYPQSIVREGLVNALVHRDYSSFSGNVSVFVFPKRLEIQNSGGFPDGVTVEGLKTGHISVLRNPDIANVLFLQDLMEKVGRGSLLIQKQCKKSRNISPEWREDENKNVILTFYATEVTTEVTQQVTQQVKKLLLICNDEMSRVELMKNIGLKDRVSFSSNYVEPALKKSLIEMTEPDSPKSPTQKYRLTLLGKQLKEKFRKIKSETKKPK